MSQSALVIQHVAFEDLGSFAPILARQGFVLEYAEASHLDWDSLDPSAHDLWIVLGGPIGVYESRDYPFLTREIQALQQRLAADRPTLGICLGGQLIAAALGARVYPGGFKEIGWAPLQLTAHPGCLSALDNTPVLHWHGDTFDLPAGADLLASTALCPHQAFQKGRALALQFHPEVTAAGLERWFIGHTLEISKTEGVSVTGLRADTARYAPGLETHGAEMLMSWLEKKPVAHPAEQKEVPFFHL